MSTPWQAIEPTRAEIDARPGPLLLEFGSPSCGHCRAAQPLIEQALSAHALPPPHLKIADGPGQPLGRSFGVKLWSPRWCSCATATKSRAWSGRAN